MGQNELVIYIDKMSDDLSLISDLISEFAEHDQKTLISIPKLHESIEKIFIDFNHVIDSLTFNTTQVTILLKEKKKYSDKDLKESNIHIVDLAGHYSGARNSFAWLKANNKEKHDKLDNLYIKIKNLIFDFDRAVIKYNENLEEKYWIYTMNKAYQIWKEHELKNPFFDDQL